MAKTPKFERPEVELPGGCHAQVKFTVNPDDNWRGRHHLSIAMVCHGLDEGEVQPVGEGYIKSSYVTQDRLNQEAEMAALAVHGLCGQCDLNPLLQKNRVPDDPGSIDGLEG